MMQLSEKYAPKSLDQLILLPRIKKQIDGGKHLMLHGKAGMGKTSLAKILSGHYEKPHNVKFLSGSNVNIETLRNELEAFTNPNSFIGYGETKFVIVDEFDEAPPKFINAIRPFIEAKEGNTRFIFTANLTNTNTTKDSLEGVYDRFNRVYYAPLTKDEKDYLIKEYGKRLVQIAKNEGLEVDNNAKKNILTLINNNFPSFRGCLKEMDIVISSKSFDSVTPQKNIDSGEVIEIFDLLINKDSTEVALYVYENIFDNDVLRYYKALQSEILLKYIFSNYKDTIDIGNFLLTIKDDISILLAGEVLSKQTLLITTLINLKKWIKTK